MIDIDQLIEKVSFVVPSYVQMKRRPIADAPQDVILEWRPDATEASLLDIAWEDNGYNIQIIFGLGYFDLWQDKNRLTDNRLQEISEYAEAISLGRLVTFSETERKLRTQTTVFGCRSGPRIYRESGRTHGEADIYVQYAPW